MHTRGKDISCSNQLLGIVFLFFKQASWYRLFNKCQATFLYLEHDNYAQFSISATLVLTKWQLFKQI